MTVLTFFHKSIISSRFIYVFYTRSVLTNQYSFLHHTKIQIFCIQFLVETLAIPQTNYKLFFADINSVLEHLEGAKLKASWFPKDLSTFFSQLQFYKHNISIVLFVFVLDFSKISQEKNKIWSFFVETVLNCSLSPPKFSYLQEAK